MAGQEEKARASGADDFLSKPVDEDLLLDMLRRWLGQRERGRVLVVDDEPFNVDLLEQELELLAYSTVAARNGSEALERLAEGGIISCSLTSTCRVSTDCGARTHEGA